MFSQSDLGSNAEVGTSVTSAGVYTQADGEIVNKERDTKECGVSFLTKHRNSHFLWHTFIGRVV